MRQLLQDVSSGDIQIADVPAPARGAAELLVATRRSVISPGTERAVMELGKLSLAGKARARPDLAKKVIESVREEGVSSAYRKVRGRLEQPNPLGYSSCGIVLEAPEDSPAGPGDLVACAGAGHAAHAEIVAVPRNLCARVPDGVAPDDAAYATIAAIALHGLRLCEPQVGDVVAVIGLGVVGQLALELAAAAGCVAIGFDPAAPRAAVARDAGLVAGSERADLEAEVRRHTAGRGADAVIVAAASKDATPLALAVDIARERATVSIVGDVPVEASRAALFAKEVRLVVSRSYGPGRYDPVYEERGVDYPAGYVRWTEGRNLEEVLRLMADGRLRPSRLTTHSFDIAGGVEAYRLLEGDEPSLGIVLGYPENGSPQTARAMKVQGRRVIRNPIARDRPRIAVIGAGTFARSVLLPTLVRRAEIAAVVNATGTSAKAAAERFGAGLAATDPEAVLGDASIDAVFIATRHDTHADLTARALAAGKHVFVEKPPAIDAAGLEAVAAAARADGAGTLTVGFNRRHAPLAGKLREALSGRGPLVVGYRVNAGRIPRNHWIQDPSVGGGRIVGEVCHFVDFAAYLCGPAPAVAGATAAEGSSETRDDTVVATLTFPGGSIATVTYSALGDPSLPKERVEVLGEAGAAVLDDFRLLELHRGGAREQIRGRRDKGHAAEMDAFVESCRTGEPSQDVEEIVAVMRATFAIRDAIHGRG